MAHALRPATSADRDALYALHRATMREYVAASYGGWDEADQLARFAAYFDPDPARVSVIEVEGQLAGALRLAWHGFDGGAEVRQIVAELLTDLRGRTRALPPAPDDRPEA